MLIGGIEAGGTKMVCAVAEVDGDGKVEILERMSIPTRMPEETFADMIAFFEGKGTSIVSQFFSCIQQGFLLYRAVLLWCVPRILSLV